jgi:hypothetical protein
MTHRDDAEAVWFLATRMSVLATAETTAGALGLIEAVVPPGFSPPLHSESGRLDLMTDAVARGIFVAALLALIAAGSRRRPATAVATAPEPVTMSVCRCPHPLEGSAC